MHNEELSTLEFSSWNCGNDFKPSRTSACESKGCSKSNLSFQTRNVGNMSSDSEDDLPSYGFQWKHNIKTCLESEDHVDTVNINAILLRREREEMFAKVHKLDDILKAGLNLNSDSERSKIIETSDDDVKYILETAKQMEVVESIVKTKPHYVLIKPEFSMRIFNFQTLNIGHFVPQDIWKCTKLARAKVENHVTIESFGEVDYSKTVDDSIFTYCLYLMSVHPDERTTEVYFNSLCEEKRFFPCVSDFINIFRNWGCKLLALYRIVPESYTGLHRAIKFEHPKWSMEVKEHNLHYVFRYLMHLMTNHYFYEFLDLFEPLMRMYFDVRIYDVSLRRIVSQILASLTIPIVFPSKIFATKSISLRYIHLKDFTLQQQMIICTRILRRTQFAIPLGYAALQQFLGCTNIKYCKHIELEEVYNLLITNTNIIEESSYLDIYCFLQIIEIFLCQKLDINGQICEPEINHENWHDLFHDWSLRICNSDNCADPVYVKEKIAQVQYLLRMKKARTSRKYRVCNNFRKYYLNGIY